MLYLITMLINMENDMVDRINVILMVFLDVNNIITYIQIY